MLEAAGKLLAERGYAGTTIAAVAAEAGVAPETVYAAFRNKPTPSDRRRDRDESRPHASDCRCGCRLRSVAAQPFRSTTTG